METDQTETCERVSSLKIDSVQVSSAVTAVSDPEVSPKRPLPIIASAFTKLVNGWQEREDLATSHFAEACDHLSILFQLLGVAFSFGGRDYIEKVKDLKKASATYGTLPQLVDNDVQKGTVRKPGSHSRNLLRVKRGLELNRALFEILLTDSSVSLKDSALKAYNEVFAPYHSWTIQRVVGAGMFALPSKQKFLQRLNEDEQSWKKGAEEYVKSSEPVIEYVENLFKARNIALDW